MSCSFVVVFSGFVYVWCRFTNTYWIYECMHCFLCVMLFSSFAVLVRLAFFLEIFGAFCFFSVPLLSLSPHIFRSLSFAHRAQFIQQAFGGGVMGMLGECMVQVLLRNWHCGCNAHVFVRISSLENSSIITYVDRSLPLVNKNEYVALGNGQEPFATSKCRMSATTARVGEGNRATFILQKSASEL